MEIIREKINETGTKQQSTSSEKSKSSDKPSDSLTKNEEKTPTT